MSSELNNKVEDEARLFPASKYITMDAEEVVQTHVRELRKVRTLSLAGIFLMTLVVVVVILRSSFFVALVGIMAYAVAARGTLNMEQRTSNDSWKSISAILVQDCDPRKMLKVLSKLEEREDAEAAGKRKSAKRQKAQAALRDNLSVWRGMCMAYMHEYKEALALADSVGQGDPKGKVVELGRAINLANLRLVVAKAKGDQRSVEEILSLAKDIDSRMYGKHPLIKESDQLLLEATFAASCFGDDLEQCQVQSERVIDAAVNKLPYVEARFDRGRILARRGELEEAREDFTYVNLEGGTLADRVEAKHWLSKH